MRVIALLFLASVAYGQQATCWPVPSNLKKYHSYFCAIDVPPGAVVTGRQLMAALAELEPLPNSLAVQAGGDQNRLSPQNIVSLTEQYILPGISAATALDGIKISETHWQTLVVLSPIIFSIVKGLVVGTAEPEWSRPAALITDGEIPVDSRGSASAAIYTRREGGVRRVNLATTPAAPSVALTLNFEPTNWYTLLVESQAGSAKRLQMNHFEQEVALLASK